MNDELSDDIKKKFMLPLTIELQDHKENVFHNAPVSPINIIIDLPISCLIIIQIIQQIYDKSQALHLDI